MHLNCYGSYGSLSNFRKESIHILKHKRKISKKTGFAGLKIRKICRKLDSIILLSVASGEGERRNPLPSRNLENCCRKRVIFHGNILLQKMQKSSKYIYLKIGKKVIFHRHFYQKIWTFSWEFTKFSEFLVKTRNILSANFLISHLWCKYSLDFDDLNSSTNHSRFSLKFSRISSHFQ